MGSRPEYSSPRTIRRASESNVQSLNQTPHSRSIALRTKILFGLHFFTRLAFVSSPPTSSWVAAHLAAARRKMVSVSLIFECVARFPSTEADETPDTKRNEACLGLHSTFVMSTDCPFEDWRRLAP